MNFLTSIYNTLLFQPLLNLLVLLMYYVPGHDAGVAIIILTIIVRIILYPLSNKSLKSQRALQELQPKIDEIRKEHKDNKEKQSQELMKFYKENKINPLSSCLPMLVQLPIIFALYRVFRIGLTEESLQYLYSFVPHLDSVNATLFGVVDLSTPNMVMAILAGAFQFVQSWLLMKKKKKEKQPQPKKGAANMANMMSKQMLYFMPILTVFIAWNLPSGLALYWIVTTLFSIGQQWIIMKKMDKETDEKPDKDKEDKKNKKVKAEFKEIKEKKDKK